MVRQWNYPTAFSSWGEEEKAAIARVNASGQYTMAHEVERAEAELAKFHKRRHAIMVNSGSSANLVAVAALFHRKDNPLRPGDKAVVPALAWPTTYAPLVQYNLRLTLVDADNTWNMDKDDVSLEGSLKDARLIMVANILGNPANLNKWTSAALNLGAYMIEDNCESFGATYGDRLCGSFGDMSTLSFFYSHQLSAIEGGAILTDDDELARLCRLLRNHGWTKGVEKPQSFSEEYNFVLMGYNLRPLEMHAAILVEQIKKANKFKNCRIQNYHYAFERMSHIPGVNFPLEREQTSMNPFGIAFTVGSEKQRDYLAAQFRAAGIDCRPPVGGSLGRKPYGATWSKEPTGNADRIDACGIMIGNAPYPITRLIDNAVTVMGRTL